MAASEDRPGRGVFVRDQVAALRQLGTAGEAGGRADVELFEFAPGATRYPLAAAALHRRYAKARLDVVHSHFGLTAWPALAVPARARVVTLHGTDLRHPRTRRLTLAALRHVDLVAVASNALAAELPPSAANIAVLPCGVGLDRFRVIPRDAARTALGLDPNAAHLLFPADPARPGKRFDRARELAAGTNLITLGATRPEHVALAINAANAVIVPSEAEGFGLAVLEALACDVPVLATPVGNHAEALDGIEGTLCADWDLPRWRAALAPVLASADPRIDGAARAAEYSSTVMAARVLDAWSDLLAGKLAGPGR